jgi:tRNA(fMet)-specific endonuclease VapC
VIYLLDTNVCIRFVNRSNHGVVVRMSKLGPDALRMSVVTVAEMLNGALRSPRSAENLRTLREFRDTIASVPFDDDAAEHAGRIRAELAGRGRQIGWNDVLIAATARAQQMTLVTHNLSEFSRVEGLRVEDWES